MRLAILGATTLFALTSPAFAQTASAPSAPAASNPAYAPNVTSMDAIVSALYASISGDAGVARDWDRFRHLFHPSAKLMPTGTDAQGQGTLRPLTPQDYVDRAGPGLVRDGFHEQEIARTDRYGRIAHVFSTYEARRAATDAQPFMRGINSIQLFDAGNRWWIVSVYWQAETPDLPLPADYLPEAN